MVIRGYPGLTDFEGDLAGSEIIEQVAAVEQELTKGAAVGRRVGRRDGLARSGFRRNLMSEIKTTVFLKKVRLVKFL